MVDMVEKTVHRASDSGAATMAGTAGGTLRDLVWIYVKGSLAAVVVTLLLVLLGLELTLGQLAYLLVAMPFIVAIYVIGDIYIIARHYRPIGAVLARLARGDRPPSAEVSKAIARTLNLPFYSFIRVTFFHGPAAAILLVLAMFVLNVVAGTGYQPWQVWILGATILIFASPTHAIFEFFAISRRVSGLVKQLWPYCEGLERADQDELISIKLSNKLMYLSVFVAALPLLFFAASVIFKVDLLIADLGIEATSAMLLPLWMWIAGVVLVCMGGALAMSVLTANEMSRSAAELAIAMHKVEHGELDTQLSVSGTDEYADLFRGFNLMVEGLRDEARILEVSHDLSGELQLDALLGRIMSATTDLLDAERSTLFVFDAKTDELWSRVAEGLENRDIRFPADAGIAGAVFSSGETVNTSTPYDDPRFNPDFDQQTGFVTRSLLCMPIASKSGHRIGVTQVLNKRRGDFTLKDEARLRAFTAQIAMSLENAQLFDDVLTIKNYNESIIESTSNGLITLDDERRVVTVNEAACRLVGLAQEALVGRTADELCRDANAWILDSLDRVEDTGEEDISVDADFVLADGETKSMNLTVVPLIGLEHEPIGSMLIIEDITSEKRVKTTMARYMSKEVADQLLAGGEAELGGKDQKVSILFSDVRGFTSSAETLGARETVAMLNEYFAEMVDAIFQHGGILDKYIGDAIMALFGAPFDGPHDADDAVRTANDMMIALRRLNARRAANNRGPIHIGIGISTGIVVAGSIGSPRRMEYTVIGDSVNLAARLESATKFYGCGILLSEHTVRDMTNGALMREIDLIRVKGKDEPVAVFEALDYHTDETFPGLHDVLENYTSGLTKYRAGAWDAAAGCFRAALAISPDDQPSQIYLDRCDHYRAHPPGPDWDGVWTMTEK